MAHPDLDGYYRQRSSTRWVDRLARLLTPPRPFVMNPAEQLPLPPCERKRSLYVGGAGCSVSDFVNIDIVVHPGVDVVADLQKLPFRKEAFLRVECDAVLEHVLDPQESMREIERVLAPGGVVHIVTPFCHPFHEYPRDLWRFTLDGLRRLAPDLEELHAGWRTGPTATMLLFVIEYFKLLLPFRAWRVLVHGILGWILFPLRYLDLLYLRQPQAGRIGNHCFLWLRKPDASPPPHGH